MDPSPLILFLHIVFVVIWVGGGAAMVVLGARAESTKDDAELGRVIQTILYIGPNVFAVAAIGALICGLFLAWWQWSFTDLWVILGLVGFAASAATGGRFIRPKTERVVALVADGVMTEAAIAEAREILRIARFDSVLMFVIIADMVFKPALADYPTLIVMAAVLAAAAYYFLGGRRL
jgi:hypothetical protein